MAPHLLLQSTPIILRLIQFNCKQKNLIRPFFHSWMPDNWLSSSWTHRGIHTLLLTRQETIVIVVYVFQSQDKNERKKKIIESANHFWIMEMVEKLPVKRFCKRMVLNGTDKKKEVSN